VFTVGRFLLRTIFCELYVHIIEFELVTHMGCMFIHIVLDVQLCTFVSRPKNKIIHKDIFLFESIFLNYDLIRSVIY